VPRKRKHARDGVAERGVAQVADVGRLVGIDRRVFDDGLLGSRGLERDLLRDARQQERAPVEETFR
jgi:hypothetical protein